MTYVTYDPSTGEVISISNSLPSDTTNCLAVGQTLSGSTSDYVVRDGKLYLAEQASNTFIDAAAVYYIVYDYSMIVVAVIQASAFQEDSLGTVYYEDPNTGEHYYNWIESGTDPGNIVGSTIENFVTNDVNLEWQGYVDSQSDLPSTGNSQGYYCITRTSPKVVYIWNGTEWVTPSKGSYSDYYPQVSSVSELPSTGNESGDIYKVGTGSYYSAYIYEWDGSEWVKYDGPSSPIPRDPVGRVFNTNSYWILTEIVSEPIGEISYANANNTIGSSITNLGSDSAGQDVIVTIHLEVGNWAVRSSGSEESEESEEAEEAEDTTELSMVYVIASDYIRHNTILQVTGVNQGALRGDITWTSSDGYITFQTEYGLDPYDDVIIQGMFHSTTDSWYASGTINAWPQGEWRKVQYQQSANVPNWSIDIRAGDSVLIETPLNMTFARLLYISPEWCGNTHAFLTQYYVGSGNNKLYLRITNLATQPIRIDDILLSIIYSGNIVNFIAPNGLAEEDSASTVSSEGATDTYITDEDIDEVT